MIDKRILIFGSIGTAAIIVVFSLIIKSNQVLEITTNKHQNMTCSEVQEAINSLDKPGYNRLPSYIIEAVEHFRKQNGNCVIQGKNWTLFDDAINHFPDPNEKEIIGKETTNTTDGKNTLDLVF
jgi:hypothetical protein